MFVLINGEEIIPVVEAGEELKLAVGGGGGGMDRSAIKDSAGRGGEGGEGASRRSSAASFSCGM